MGQAHSVLAHLGTAKTLADLRDHLWWKDMATDIRKYCETCITYKRSKPSNQWPYWLLHPLPTPMGPWETIGIGFMGPLPISKDLNGEYNSLMSMVHLVPSRTDYTAKELAELVFTEVYKYHGLPQVIVGDRDSLFTTVFWTRLRKFIGVEQRLSSAYHPQTNGATERANRTISQMLRLCISSAQRD